MRFLTRSINQCYCEWYLSGISSWLWLLLSFDCYWIADIDATMIWGHRTSVHQRYWIVMVIFWLSWRIGEAYTTCGCHKGVGIFQLNRKQIRYNEKNSETRLSREVCIPERNRKLCAQLLYYLHDVSTCLERYPFSFMYI